MGCDGGSIPVRSELVKTKQKEETADKQVQLQARWTSCTLSKRPLKQPIVSCLLGKLYNKDAVLELLLDRKSYGDADIICPHIKSMKNVTTLKLTPNTDTIPQQSAIIGHFTEKANRSSFICPISKKEMNGRNRFCYSLTCGCVISEQAIKTITSETCLVCNKPFSLDEVILINPTTELEVKDAQSRLANFKAKKKGSSIEKGKKRKSEPALLSSSDEDRKSAKMSNINMDLPDLTMVTNLKHKSKAIASLFAKDEDKEKNQTFLTRGMFNRYVAH
jgi:hypothetical protein